MKLRVHIEAHDIEKLSAFVAQYASHPFFVSRRSRNIERVRRAADCAEFWEALALERIRAVGGLRFGPKISAELGENLRRLRAGAWSTIERVLAELERPHAASHERAAAHSLDATLIGIGPKQARNLLQMLGLTRFEIPLDSRVMKWLSDFGMPLPLDSDLLSSSSTTTSYPTRSSRCVPRHASSRASSMRRSSPASTRRMRGSPNHCDGEHRELAAQGLMSQGLGSDAACLPRESFLRALSEAGVSPLHETGDDIRETLDRS